MGQANWSRFYFHAFIGWLCGIWAQTIFRSECSSITRSMTHRTASQVKKKLKSSELRGLALVIYPVKFHSPEHLNLFVFVNPSPRLQRWARLTDQGSMSMPSLADDVQFVPMCNLSQFPNQMFLHICLQHFKSSQGTSLKLWLRRHPMLGLKPGLLFFSSSFQ